MNLCPAELSHRRVRPATEKTVQISRTEAQRRAPVARARCKSAAAIAAHRRRMADAGGVIGELRNQDTVP